MRKASGDELLVPRGSSPHSGHLQSNAAFPSSQRFAASQARSSLMPHDKAEQNLRTELSILRAQMEEVQRTTLSSIHAIENATS